ncbi:MAG TPA: histidine kinase [Steroidobacteraceae bacterium]|nr:histidine kinase [Steroidobacteraceae bacterium]
MFWLLMITVAVEDNLHNPTVRWWAPICWEGSSALVCTCWMIALLRMRGRYAQYLGRPLVWLGCYLRWLPLVATTFVPAAYGIRHVVYAAFGLTYRHPSWAFVFPYECLKLTLFLGLWLGILFGFDSYAQWQQQRRHLLTLQRALADAQLARLQGQLRPHFFFNALNTISALMHVDVARADRLVAGLGDLLHISLRSGEREIVPLAEELRALQLYANIMQERFRDRVTLHWEIDRELLDTPVPALLLQPLLENAFKHGVECALVPVRIEVCIGHNGRALKITLRNTGSRLARNHAEGVGLRNCRERLSLIYGEAASLRIGAAGEVVTAQVVIPLADERA